MSEYIINVVQYIRIQYIQYRDLSCTYVWTRLGDISAFIAQ